MPCARRVCRRDGVMAYILQKHGIEPYLKTLRMFPCGYFSPQNRSTICMNWLID